MSDDPRPYRPNVGIALFNAAGLVLIARRIKDDGPEMIFAGHEWQMPQGGIDEGEDPFPAAKRELFEETGVTSADYLGETPDWIPYEFPSFADATHRLAHFRGQRQKWFALRFTGDEREIDVVTARTGEEVEFDSWRWERLARLPDLVVPFKRTTYHRVAAAFAPYAAR